MIIGQGEFVRLNTIKIYYYNICKSNSIKSWLLRSQPGLLALSRQKENCFFCTNMLLCKNSIVIKRLLAVQRIVDQWFSGILQQILNEFENVGEMHRRHYPQKNPWASSSASRTWKTLLSLVGTFVTDLLGFSLFCPLFKDALGSLSHSSCPLVSEFPENAHLKVGNGNFCIKI